MLVVVVIIAFFVVSSFVFSGRLAEGAIPRCAIKSGSLLADRLRGKIVEGSVVVTRWMDGLALSCGVFCHSISLETIGWQRKISYLFSLALNAISLSWIFHIGLIR